jgi:hypothetical protein
MEVYVIPIGRDRYELYCEVTPDPEALAEPGATAGLFGRLRDRFAAMLRAAEEKQLRRADPIAEPQSGLGRFQDRILGWVVQRIAEQRLLWNLRRQAAVTAVHPQDMTFDRVHTLVRRTLQRDYERHRLWLVVDTLGLVVSGPLTVVPGPNVLAYYFAFRVVGHWLSMRGASQGLERVVWSGRPCEVLSELRELSTLEAAAREARLRDIAARLSLPHLSTFFDRVKVRHA